MMPTILGSLFAGVSVFAKMTKQTTKMKFPAAKAPVLISAEIILLFITIMLMVGLYSRTDQSDLHHTSSTFSSGAVELGIRGV